MPDASALRTTSHRASMGVIRLLRYLPKDSYVVPFWPCPFVLGTIIYYPKRIYIQVIQVSRYPPSLHDSQGSLGPSGPP